MRIQTQVASDCDWLERSIKQLCNCRGHALGIRQGTVRKATFVISDVEEWVIFVSRFA